MNINCPQCQMQIKLAISQLPPGGIDIRCPRCRHRFHHDDTGQTTAAPNKTERSGRKDPIAATFREIPKITLETLSSEAINKGNKEELELDLPSNPDEDDFDFGWDEEPSAAPKASPPRATGAPAPARTTPPPRATGAPAPARTAPPSAPKTNDALADFVDEVEQLTSDEPIAAPKAAPPKNNDALADFVDEVEQLTSDAPVAPPKSAPPRATGAPAPARTAPAPSGGGDPLAGLVAELEQLTDEPKAEGAEESDETQYHIRRESGKVFGPFPVSAIKKMLTTKQLSGKEELSPDGGFWSPMVDWPEFRDQLLSEGMTALQEEAAAPVAAATPSPAAAIPAPAPTPLDATEEEWDIDDLEPISHTAPSEEFEFDADEVADFAPPEPVSPPTRKVPGNIRSALKDEVLQQELEGPNNKLPPPPVIAGIAALVLLLMGSGVYYFFFMGDGGPANTIKFKTNPQRTFRTDAYKTYKKVILPRLRRQVESHPKSEQAQVLLGMGLASLLEHHYDKALKLELANIVQRLSDVTKEKPATQARSWLEAMFAITKRRPKQALKWLKNIKPNSKYAVDALYAKATALCIRGQYKQAQKTFSALLKRRKQHARGLYGRGKCYLKRKQWSKAFQSFYGATLISKHHLPSYRALIELEPKVPEQKGRYKLLWEPAEKAFIASGHSKWTGQFFFSRAQRAFQGRHYEDAVKWLDQAIKFDKTNKRYLDKQPRYLFATRNYTRTINRLKKRIREPHPLVAEYYLRAAYRLSNWTAVRQWNIDARKKSFQNNANIWYLRGLIQKVQNRIPLAVKYFTKALELSKQKHLPSKVSIASILQKTNQKEKAQQLWQQVLDATTTKKDKDETKGDDKEGKTPTPKGKAKKTKQAKKPKRAYHPLDLALAQAHYLRQAGDFEKIVPILKPFRKTYPRDEIVNGLLAVCYMKQTQYPKAVKLFTLTFEVDPKNYEALMGLAEIAEKQGRLKEAKDSYLKLLKLNKRDAKVLYRLGRIYFSLKQYPQAQKSLERSNDFDGKIADVHYYLARINEIGKKPFSTVQDKYEKAIELDPKQRRYLYRFANYLYRQRQVDKALRIYTRLLRNRKQSKAEKAEVYFERGKLYMDVRAWRLAIRDTQRAQRMQPKKMEYILQLGEAYREARRFPQAARWYRKYERALRSVSKDTLNEEQLKQRRVKLSKVYGRLGDISRERNKFKQAIRYYRRALRQDKNAVIYYRHLGYLYKDTKRWSQCTRVFSKFLKKAPRDHMDRREVQNDLRSCRSAQFE